MESMDDDVFSIGGRTYGCPLHLSLAVIAGKWKGLVIWFLYDAGKLRYGEVKRKVNEYVTVSAKMLIAALRELERDGLIERTVFPVVPPKVEYALTKAGRRAVPIIEAMEAFGAAYQMPEKKTKRRA
jgi:DNA-binding HxlR family transcriptional regulator